MGFSVFQQEVSILCKKRLLVEWSQYSFQSTLLKKTFLCWSLAMVKKQALRVRLKERYNELAMGNATGNGGSVGVGLNTSTFTAVNTTAIGTDTIGSGITGVKVSVFIDKLVDYHRLKQLSLLETILANKHSAYREYGTLSGEGSHKDIALQGAFSASEKLKPSSNGIPLGSSSGSGKIKHTVSGSAQSNSNSRQSHRKSFRSLAEAQRMHDMKTLLDGNSDGISNDSSGNSERTLADKMFEIHMKELAAGFRLKVKAAIAIK